MFRRIVGLLCKHDRCDSAKRMYIVACEHKHQWRDGFNQYVCLCVQGGDIFEWFDLYIMWSGNL